MHNTTYSPFKDVAHSALLWQIWVRLGMQDIQRRFRRSSIGIAWIFFNLIIMILALGLVYGALFGQNLSKFIPLLTASLITWWYLTSSIVEGGNAFVASEGYIKQIGLPIYVYIFRFFVNISLTASIRLPVYVVVVLIYRAQIGWGILWVIPGLALLAMVSLLAVAIFAYLNARFRDVSHLTTSLMQVLFYITPIAWPAEVLRQRGLGFIIDFNPFYHILEVVRRPLLTSGPADPINYLVVGLVIVLMGSLAAWLIRFYHRRIVFFL
jgi:lipopolysaccharide transport system permease protein